MGLGGPITCATSQASKLVKHVKKLYFIFSAPIILWRKTVIAMPQITPGTWQEAYFIFKSTVPYGEKPSSSMAPFFY